MQITISNSITCFLLTIACPLFSSSFQIVGSATVTCLPAEEIYAIEGIAPQNGYDNTYQLHWEVQGGKFPNGDSKVAQTWPDFKPVTVRWNYGTGKMGVLTVQLKKGNATIQSASKNIMMGLPEPRGIWIEGGYLECEGNWFEVKAEFPLSGSEVIEWQVKNGLDENNSPVSFLIKQGAEAHRLFLKKENLSLPLQISVRFVSDCGRTSSRTPVIHESFQNPRPKLIAPPNVRAGKENTFLVCPMNGYQNTRWRSDGAIVEASDGSAVIYFPQAGEKIVQVFLDDCNGTTEEIPITVKVKPSDTESGQALLATSRTGLAYRIYPNPSLHGLLNVEMFEEAGEGQVEIINLQGKQVSQVRFTQYLTVIQTGDLPPGIYLLRIKTSKGEAVSRVGINLY